MWPPGHLAVAYLAYAGYFRFRSYGRPAGSAVLVLVVASLLPDLIDKPLAWWVGILPSGRSLGHSILVIGPLTLLVYRWFSRRGRTLHGIAFAIGAWSHLILDALPVLWGDTSVRFLLYPLLDVQRYDDGAPEILELLADSLRDPYFLVEIPLFAIAVLVWFAHDRPGATLIRKYTFSIRGSDD